MSEAAEFTPTQMAILEVLSDGATHQRSELLKCIPDDLADTGALHQAVCRLRKRLKKRGETIRCVVENNKSWYQHTRLVSME